MKQPVRVLIVDDSALTRMLLKEILEADPAIRVVGAARDPYMAREMIRHLDPDVLTLDVQMPKMDGMKFLRNLMRLRPMPVVMVSAFTDRDALLTEQALALGAVDFIHKPSTGLAQELRNYSQQIISKIKNAAAIPVKVRRSGRRARDAYQELPADLPINGHAAHRPWQVAEPVIAIGASAGGTEAIRNLLSGLPASTPGTVITQHIPPYFSAQFAARVNSATAMQVCEAQDGQQILAGHAYISPGDKHLLLRRRGNRYFCRLDDGPPVNGHKPAVDLLFRSTAQNVGPSAMGVLLTGMGNDGACGLKELQEAGATTIAQDEDTSLIWGMPGAAVKLGAVDMVLPLNEIAAEVKARLPGKVCGS